MTSPGIPCSFLASPTWLEEKYHDASVKGFVGICQHNLRFSTWGVVCRFVNPFHKLSASSRNHVTQQSLTESKQYGKPPQKPMFCFQSMVHVSLSYISESQFFLGHVWSNRCFNPLSPPQGLSALPPLHPQKFVTFRIVFFVETWQKHENIILWVCVYVNGNYQCTDNVHIIYLTKTHKYIHMF